MPHGTPQSWFDMEEAALCAPRLARDFFRNPNCWSPSVLSASPLQGASDLGHGGQAPLSAEINLHVKGNNDPSPSINLDANQQEITLHVSKASDPNQPGQASSFQGTSDPHKGQVPSQNAASDPDFGQANFLVASDHLWQATPFAAPSLSPAPPVCSSHGIAPASMPAIPVHAGYPPSSHFSTATPSNTSAPLISSTQAFDEASSANISTMAADTPISSHTTQSASCVSLVSSSSCMTTCMVSLTSSAAAPSSITSIPAIHLLQPLHATFSTPPCMAAIAPSTVNSPSRLPSPPALLTFTGWDDNLSRSSPSYEWPDESGLNFASPSTTIAPSLSSANPVSSPPPAIPVLKPSPLRAYASPWQPGQQTPPSLFVGDIPLSPSLSSSSTNFNSLPLQQALLLPANARQSLASPHSAGLLGKGQQFPCCPLCGFSSTTSPRGPTSHTTFGFSPLRGRIVADQARESNALHSSASRQYAAPTRFTARPRFKMKA